MTHARTTSIALLGAALLFTILFPELAERCHGCPTANHVVSHCLIARGSCCSETLPSTADPLTLLQSGNIDPATFPWHLVRPPEAATVSPQTYYSIHPVQVTVLILFAALGAAIWAADEWDWHRLLEGDEGGVS